MQRHLEPNKLPGGTLHTTPVPSSPNRLETLIFIMLPPPVKTSSLHIAQRRSAPLEHQAKQNNVDPHARAGSWLTCENTFLTANTGMTHFFVECQ